MSAISVTVNKKPVEIYDSDSNETFIERVAAVFQLHPNFFEEINIEKLKEGDEIKVDNLISEIQSYEYDEKDIDNNIEFIQSLIEKYNKNTQDTILKLFLSTNPFFKRDITDEFVLIELMPFDEALKSSNIDTKVIDSSKFLRKDDSTMRSERDEFMKDIRQKIVYSNQAAMALTEANREFVNMKSVDLSKKDIKKDESELKIITNLKKSDYSLSTIFSNMVCKSNTPFLTYNNLYKVYQDLDIKIPEDWVSSFSEFMILKVHIDQDKYTDCVIIYEEDVLVLNIEIKYSNFTYLSEEQLKELVRNRVKNSFNSIPDFSYVKETEINIYETVVIPEQEFDTYVLNDIIMNNNIFSKFLAVNESVQTSKKKSGIYVHYFLKNDKGTCNITSSQNIDVKGLQNIVRLRIKKAKTQDVADEFIKLVGKLLYLYKKNDKKIIEFYKKYIPNFPKEKSEKIVEPTKLNLQKQVPDLFISGYPYKCQYPPIIIGDDDVKNYPQERVMTYPIKGEGKPHNYLCDDEKNGYIYVGLRENTLKNRSRYKYIPCCFKSDQTKRRGPYLEYFKGEIVEKGPQQNIIITNKLVRNEEYGILPRNIDKLLTTFDESYNYLRKGVKPTSLSFLDCVLESVLDISEYSALPQTSKSERLEKEYTKLKNYKYISVASQENPNYSEANLKNEIDLEKSTYLDPLKWIKLCETIYKCKIIIFSRNKNERDAIISIPNHELIYLQEKFKEQKLVLIYEHYGTELELQYPRCELIIKSDKELSIEEGSINYFSGSISKNIFGFYTSIINQYYYEVFNKKLNNISMFDLTELNSLKPTHQIIDNYGKARGIVVDNILLLSTPFPPIKAERYTDNLYNDNDIQKVMDFINRNNIKIVSQNIVDDFINEINVTISNIVFTAKIRKTPSSKSYSIDNVEVDIIEKYPSPNSDISKNISLKRLAFITSEYFNYYYSLYVHNSGLKPSLESIKSFIKNKVKITNDINQSNLYKITCDPSLSSQVLFDNNFTKDLNGRFLVENNEILKRLVYSLRVQLSNNYNNIIDYHKSKEVYNFFKETTHYSENSINIIVKNVDDLEKVDNTIYERLQTEKKDFFMHNKYINNNKPFLLKSSSSKKNAFNISTNWVENGRAYIEEDQDVKTLDNTIMYLYHSLFDVKIKKDVIFENRNICYALKYRKDSEDHYMGLINL